MRGTTCDRLIEMSKPRDARARSDGNGAGAPRDILGNQVETYRDLLGEDRSAPGFRGDVSLSPPSGPASDLYRQLPDVCAPGAIAVVEGERGISLTLDKGRCIMCGMCQQAAP